MFDNTSVTSLEACFSCRWKIHQQWACWCGGSLGRPQRQPQVFMGWFSGGWILPIVVVLLSVLMLGKSATLVVIVLVFAFCDIDAFSVADLAALGFLKRVPELRLNYSGYFDLVDSLYRDMMSQDRYWVRSVTEPMWVYYCTMLLWERLYFIRSLQTRYQCPLVFASRRPSQCIFHR